jgi:hypothetical protein
MFNPREKPPAESQLSAVAVTEKLFVGEGKLGGD